MDEIIINAEGTVAGRLASILAKELLNGKSVAVVNAEKALVSGKPGTTMEDFRAKRERGDPYHGPFYPRLPDRMLKRFVRGMLPKSPRGREALKRLRVFISMPRELEGKEFAKLPGAESKLTCKTLTLEEVAKRL